MKKKRKKQGHQKKKEKTKGKKNRGKKDNEKTNKNSALVQSCKNINTNVTHKEIISS